MRLHARIPLHDAGTGQEVVVRRILFDTLRAECARLGVRAGGTIRVERRSGSQLAVALPGACTVLLGSDWARFIEVEPPAPAAP